MGNEDWKGIWKKEAGMMRFVVKTRLSWDPRNMGLKDRSVERGAQLSCEGRIEAGENTRRPENLSGARVASGQVEGVQIQWAGPCC